MNTLSETVSLESLIATHLAPRVAAIDLEGEYPEAFLRRIGAQGAFAGAVAPEHGGAAKGFAM